MTAHTNLCSLLWKPDDEASEIDIVLQPHLSYQTGNAPMQHLELNRFHSTEAPLRSRGWAFQEYVLSPRTLSYRARKMQWECLEVIEAEDGQSWRQDKMSWHFFHLNNDFPGVHSSIKSLIQTNFDHSRLPTKLSKQQNASSVDCDERTVSEIWIQRFRIYVYSQWTALISEYGRRRLTVPADVLPALSGLAVAFGSWLGDDYHAGLWSGDLLHGLMWYCSTKDVQNASQFNQTRSALGAITHVAPGSVTTSSWTEAQSCDLGFPSWSWASMYGLDVTYLQSRFAPTEYELASVRVRMAPELSFDGPGQAKGSCLEVDALFCNFKVRFWNIESSHRSGRHTTSLINVECNLPSDYPRRSYHWELARAEFWRQQQNAATGRYGISVLAQIRPKTQLRTPDSRWNVALLVEAIDEKRNIYRRIGLLHGENYVQYLESPSLAEHVQGNDSWRKRTILLV